MTHHFCRHFGVWIRALAAREQPFFTEETIATRDIEWNYDAVAFLYTIVSQNMCKLTDLVIKLFIRYFPVLLIRIIGLPDNGPLIAAVIQMPFQTVFCPAARRSAERAKMMQ